jgi:hypothetical protein
MARIPFPVRRGRLGSKEPLVDHRPYTKKIGTTPVDDRRLEAAEAKRARRRERNLGVGR